MKMPAKRPKLENTRPSRTRRNLKGSHELKVSSEITLKELKLMVSVFLNFSISYINMFNISTNEIQAHIQIDPENVSCEKKKKERKRVRNIIYDF